jgi:hypothetical protein
MRIIFRVAEFDASKRQKIETKHII